MTALLSFVCKSASLRGIWSLSFAYPEVWRGKAGSLLQTPKRTDIKTGCLCWQLLDDAAECGVHYEVYKDHRTDTVFVFNVVLKQVEMYKTKINHFLNYFCMSGHFYTSLGGQSLQKGHELVHQPVLAYLLVMQRKSSLSHGATALIHSN